MILLVMALFAAPLFAAAQKEEAGESKKISIALQCLGHLSGLF
jgi:hypothetical protein